MEIRDRDKDRFGVDRTASSVGLPRSSSGATQLTMALLPNQSQPQSQSACVHSHGNSDSTGSAALALNNDNNHLGTAHAPSKVLRQSMTVLRFELSSVPLMHTLSHHRALMWSLRFAGLVYDDLYTNNNQNDSSMIAVVLGQYAWNVLVLVTVLGFYLYFVVTNIATHSTQNVVIGTAVLCQGIGLVVSSCCNVVRLRSVHMTYDVELYRPALTSAALLGVCMFFNAVPFFFVNAYVNAITRGVIAIIYLLSNFVLAGNILFLLVDARACEKVIGSLRDRLESASTLCIEDVLTARAEIRRRVRLGFVAHTALIATALVNVIAVFAALILQSHLANPKLVVNDITSVIMLLCREVVVATFAFWCVAVVNEQQHALVKQLELQVSSHWASYRSQPERKTDICWLIVSLQTNPLTFPLVGMTLRRKDVLVRFALWLFGILLGLATRAFSKS
jgi:hypothetical protein